MEPEILILNDFVDKPEDLFEELRVQTVWDERMKSRKTASYGVAYDYSSIDYPSVPMPDYLSEICLLIESQIGFRPNNCLMNYYLDGSSTMGFHSDNAEELFEGTGVVIISLGAERHITYRLIEDKDLKVKYALEPGSLLYMSQDLQEKWQHAIKKEEGVGERISLTFRRIVK